MQDLSSIPLADVTRRWAANRACTTMCTQIREGSIPLYFFTIFVMLPIRLETLPHS